MYMNPRHKETQVLPLCSLEASDFAFRRFTKHTKRTTHEGHEGHEEILILKFSINE